MQPDPLHEVGPIVDESDPDGLLAVTGQTVGGEQTGVPGPGNDDVIHAHRTGEGVKV